MSYKKFIKSLQNKIKTNQSKVDNLETQLSGYSNISKGLTSNELDKLIDNTTPTTTTNYPSLTTMGSSGTAGSLDTWDTIATDPNGWSKYTNIQYPEGSQILPSLTKEQEDILIRSGFEFDKTTKKWKLRLSIDIELNEKDRLVVFDSAQGVINKIIVEKIKRAKEKLEEKLTAKAVLTNLIKPRKL